MAKKANDEASATRPTITVNFSDDPALYEQIVADAKEDRRTPAQFLLLHLTKNYALCPSRK